MPRTRFALVFLSLLAACSSRAPALPDAAPADDASADVATVDVVQDAGVDKAAACAATFGSELTDAFGRVDGTVLAVVPPAHPTCTQPNGTHLVLQVLFNSAAYRMVVNVLGAGSDTRVFFAETDAPLAGAPWAEGWHPGASLDYVTTLGAKSTAFAPFEQADLVATVTSRLALGARVSVFATSSGGTFASSAHLVHRNEPDADGAIVIDPDTKPHYLLFRFPNQTF